VHKIEKQHRELLDKLTETNRALDRIASLLVSTQLLQECVSPDGEARDAETCAEIVNDSFNAGQCLHQNMIEAQREFKYQVDEFYIGGDDEHEEDEDGPPPQIALRF
jgi:uncharacterized tellurite resistance protein B-like protein